MKKQGEIVLHTTEDGFHMMEDARYCQKCCATKTENARFSNQENKESENPTRTILEWCFREMGLGEKDDKV